MMWRIALVLCVLWPVAALADIYTGQVIEVLSGDTFVLETLEGKQLEVRLAEIDAPEPDQPYSAEAQEALFDLVGGQTARAIVLSYSAGQAKARVFVGDTNVNYRMVWNGDAMAWHGYVSDYMLYSLEAKAREKGWGLWALPEEERMPPWEWREARQLEK